MICNYTSEEAIKIEVFDMKWLTSVRFATDYTGNDIANYTIDDEGEVYSFEDVKDFSVREDSDITNISCSLSFTIPSKETDIPEYLTYAKVYAIVYYADGERRFYGLGGGLDLRYELDYIGVTTKITLSSGELRDISYRC